jgi:heat-inducible transcriptional repressor
MADLEEMGYLSQPHTSAGRVPTSKAYRYYVDTILDVRTLTQIERALLKRSYHPSKLNITETLKDTCRMLSAASNFPGLAITPQVGKVRFEHIQFVRLAPFQVLALFVTTSGIIENRRLDVEEDLTQEYLDTMTRYLDTILSGLTLLELRQRILEEMRKEKIAYDRLMQRALKLGERALLDTGERELFIEGQVRIFETPEFGSIERMKGLLQALEEKGFLLQLLDQSLKTPGVQIIIGSEFEHVELSECSLVTAPYGAPDSPRGTLGVIGPIRMDYSRIISLVDFTAQLLTQDFVQSDA